MSDEVNSLEKGTEDMMGVSDDGNDIADQSDMDVEMGGPVGNRDDHPPEDDDAKEEVIETVGRPRSVNVE